MGKKNKKVGFNKQGIRDLSHLKSTPRGIRLPDPPGMGVNCEHPEEACHLHRDTGITHCTSCGARWDEENIPI
jgi:hypothetical protein